MRTIAIAQARMGSTRAPGKVMRDLGGKPVLRWTVDALRATQGVDEVIVATSTLPADNIIADYCLRSAIKCWRGPEEDVLTRFKGAADHYRGNIILRLTCDCPFLDPQVIGEVIKLREATAAEYASNVNPPTYPDGLDVECFTYLALQVAHNEATRPSDRECVTQYIVRNQSRLTAVNARCPVPGLAKERWVLDTEQDYEFCEAVVDKLGGGPYSYLQVLKTLDDHPEIRLINAKGIRNERFYQDISTEDLPVRSFDRSNEQFSRAAKFIPFGAQTFSKSHLQYPVPNAPLFVTHGDGARVFDVDGNDYIDLVSGLLPIILGYRDPDVDEAVHRQLDRGITFSLSTELEAELAQLMMKHIPCAEMVKFGKNGSDVTSAAIRLARHYTNRQEIWTTGGYHGWHDWAVERTGRDCGVPISGLSACVDWKRIIAESDPGIAAVIVEPNQSEGLSELRFWCSRNGSLLIFDEVITGFRYSLGGAQKLFGVTPDLACFGKAMANGMPISALVGKKEIMEKMQPPDNIFYSGTMFGETLSIAAAIATIKKLERDDVLDRIAATGAFLMEFIRQEIEACRLQKHIKISGHPSRSILTFASDDIKTLFMMEMLQNGVLIINANNLSLAHESETERIMSAYQSALAQIMWAIDHDEIGNMLNGAMVSPSPLRAAS